MCLASLTANAVTKGKSNNFDWNKVMDAITAVESGGNPRAKSGSCVGAMQISPILVKECNIILKNQGSKKRYISDNHAGVEESAVKVLCDRRQPVFDGE